jgi:hypothetical protein
MMKKFIRNIAILVSPILLMIAVNEIVRPTISEKPYSIYKIVTINSIDKVSDKCTWTCHNNTRYCMENHVKYLKPYFNYTDKIYFGIIDSLRKTGNYVIANIIVLVVLVPLLVWLLLIKSLNIQNEINKQKIQQ